MTPDKPAPPQLPDLGQPLADALAEAGRTLGHALAGIRFTLTAQGALASVLTGDEAAARTALATLDDDQRRTVHLAASRLAILAALTAGMEG
ncbi:hypothetical protein [Thermomonospora cellulosilytica]|uniref:Phage-related tail protein n=1 Tax=Thermomonospora cellulosilytica TaxID=1411118 RepID=A0A7W3R8X0_9ACTN|nr:hypothetical protein [Thermomonospora cellulosilytica]MBA9003750.1 phage-related tail protein [Thermomonospora cellulosilytica]